MNAWEPDNGLQTLGEDLSGPPKGVRDGIGSMLVFSFSRYGNLQYKSWNQTIGTWMPTDGFQNLLVLALETAVMKDKFVPNFSKNFQKSAEYQSY